MSKYSNRLEENKEAILLRWEHRAGKETVAAFGSGVVLLRDSISFYLDDLANALATDLRMDLKSVDDRDTESVRINRLHGADRAAHPGYFLTEVNYEYHILRQVIFEVLETDGPLPTIARDVIINSIEQAVNNAAVKFSEIHADLQHTFVNTLSHDLKTPITSALLNTQLLMRSAELSPAGRKSGLRIIASMNRLTGMIHNLLDGSRLRAGEQLDLQFAEGDLAAMIGEIVNELSFVCGGRLLLQCNEAVPGKWGMDGLRRAIENLIGNAIKYGSPSAPITISLRRSEVGAEVGVHNEGSFIPSAEIPQLFRNFQRARNAQKEPKIGWGLGLTLVKGVADAHHGHVRVESVEGKGTTFFLDIPNAENLLL